MSIWGCSGTQKGESNLGQNKYFIITCFFLKKSIFYTQIPRKYSFTFTTSALKGLNQKGLKQQSQLRSQILGSFIIFLIIIYCL